MPGVRRLPSGKLQGWYYDAAGQRCYLTHEDPKATKSQVRAIAARLEDEHRQVRLGYRPPRNSADRHRTRPFSELVDEYMAWGCTQGGIGGRPWAPAYVGQRRSMLAWWQARLALETIGDLDGILPRAEAALRELLAKRSGLTAANYVAILHALCMWAERRGYLVADPLRGMAPVDRRRQQTRRALTPDEISRLLAAAPPERRLLYELALTSGLRANELRSLTGADVDVERSGLRLRAEWTKNRQDGFQPLPADLVMRLAARRCRPDEPLFHVHGHAALRLEMDLEAAQIPRWSPAGKLDFHSLRVTFVTLLVEASANVREVQALARHASPALTMGVYAKVRDAGLRGAVERIGTVLQESCAPGVHGAAKAAKASSVSSCSATTRKRSADG